MQQLTAALPYFQITVIHRDDLQSLGFDAAKVSDADMESLAGKMADDYCNQLFWESMELIAEEVVKIPRAKMPFCPLCENPSFAFDPLSGKYHCPSCGKEWSEKYVLVQFPEDPSDFERNETGYPCFNSEDNGARYVSEYDYLRHFQKDPPPNACFKAVSWPDSQAYMQEKEGDSEPVHTILARCEPIEDEKGIEDFGSSALWVPCAILSL